MVSTIGGKAFYSILRRAFSPGQRKKHDLLFLNHRVLLSYCKNIANRRFRLIRLSFTPSIVRQFSSRSCRRLSVPFLDRMRSFLSISHTLLGNGCRTGYSHAGNSACFFSWSTPTKDCSRPLTGPALYKPRWEKFTGQRGTSVPLRVLQDNPMLPSHGISLPISLRPPVLTGWTANCMANHTRAFQPVQRAGREVC